MVTEADLYSQAVQERVSYWLDEIDKRIAARDIHLPETVELTLILNDDPELCDYYLIDHVSRVEFWLDPSSTEELKLTRAVSETHLSKSHGSAIRL